MSTERGHPINPAILSLSGLHSWIPAFAGMTTGVGMGLLPSDSYFAMPYKFLTLASFVIPAKAGIQWFKQVIPATRE